MTQLFHNIGIQFSHAIVCRQVCLECSGTYVEWLVCEFLYELGCDVCSFVVVYRDGKSVTGESDGRRFSYPSSVCR